MRNARLPVGLLLFASLSLPLFAGGTLSLTDLDLSQLQTASGPLDGNEQYRTDAGFVLAAGSSLWVDLKKDASELRATIEPLPGHPGGAVVCRFSTSNDVRYVTVASQSGPQQIHLPLTGQELLVVESIAQQPGPCIRIHITSSSIECATVRPEAWGGAAPIAFHAADWDVRIDGRSGGISHLQNPGDRLAMEWVRPASPWGTGWATIDGQQQAWTKPKRCVRTGPNAMEAIYDLPRLRVRVTRALEENGCIRETYTFENLSGAPLEFGEGDLGIRIPLVDSYPGAEECLPRRCHVHLWMGGRSSYIAALRMGGAAPHLGLMLTEGALTNYSIYDRVNHSNDRGQFVVHPAAFTLQPGRRTRVSWLLFWHTGWDDFFAKAERLAGLVRLDADRYTVTRGQPLRIHVSGPLDLSRCQVAIAGDPATARIDPGQRLIELTPTQLGEQCVQVNAPDGQRVLRAFVTPPPLDLIGRRVRFIVDRQQKRSPGTRLDGAYLIFDNETGQLVADGHFRDHDAGRERLAMGTLVALYSKVCDDPAFQSRLEDSLRQYAAFVGRELTNEAGTVFDDVHRAGPLRMYNFPWAAHFFVAMYDAYGKPEYLRRALDICRNYYERGGERFYCIGMPVTEMLAALERAGWKNERQEMLAAFRKHAMTLAKIGRAYPKHEVNYEQSIVGPAAQLMLEVYLATKEPALLDAAREQLQLLELFGGRQPDYHLHDIAIRHWDDYWFGKRRMYGDTFPHYWSTITGCAFALYARATGDQSYQQRAEGILDNNLCSFRPDGSASCAYVFPRSVNGLPAGFFDPWANDQDWALVNWLEVLGPKS